MHEIYGKTASPSASGKSCIAILEDKPMSESDVATIMTELAKGFGSFLDKGADREKINLVCECQMNSLQNDDPVNILEIAEKVELGVYECSLTENVSGMLDRLERKVYIEKTESVRRKRFTCAHEVGHFLLHDYHDVVLLRSSRTDEIEREANSMAAEILMPRYFVKKFLKEKSANPNDLADAFQVSEQAAAYRISNVGS